MTENSDNNPPVPPEKNDAEATPAMTGGRNV